MSNSHAEWTIEEDDLLLNMWLSDKGIRTIAERLDRPQSTVRNRVWKLATGYKRCRKYCATQETRTSRVGLPFSRREIEMLLWGLHGEGQSRCPPVGLAHMAQVLWREVKELEEWHKEWTGPKIEGFGL